MTKSGSYTVIVSKHVSFPLNTLHKTLPLNLLSSWKTEMLERNYADLPQTMGGTLSETLQLAIAKSFDLRADRSLKPFMLLLKLSVERNIPPIALFTPSSTNFSQ